ncbi:ABC transporter ATP-binding protein [Inquilinus sp.]|jgi:branched-chain amino acid transport system ATP-binding protein|uniref:ABC transporter ATP-binding protein n=1 Tax=Inquilinus sp. TaxID=1932117 RepID=UPI0037832911
MNLLEVEDLTVAYGPIAAVRGVGLTVAAGEIVAMLGANGAGKSTTLQAITGLLPVRRGRVVFDGQPVTGRATEQIVRLGMTLVPEGRRIFASMTVEENLRIGAAVRRDGADAARVRDEMLTLFPILAARRLQTAGTLSGGEQQMLAIARALMSQPKLLLLDEPSLGLAPQVVDSIFDLLVELRRRGLTLLVVEQNVHMALEIADRAYVIAHGEVAMSGTARELLASDEVERAYLGHA